MNKRIFSTAMIMSLLLTALPLKTLAEDVNTVTINGEQVQLNYIMERDRLLVPANGIFEKLGAEVKWDKEKAEVLIEDNYTMVELFIDKNEALVYKKYDFTGIPQTVTLDVVPRVVEDTVYVPLRFVVESIDAVVEWNNDKNMAAICTKKNNKPVSYEVVSQNDVTSNSVLYKWYEGNKVNRGIYFVQDNDSTYVMISGGRMNTGGYSITLNGIFQDKDDGLCVYASVASPSKDSYVTQVISYPCIIIKIKNTNIKYINGAVY